MDTQLIQTKLNELSDLKEKYTSVELQHKAMEWR